MRDYAKQQQLVSRTTDSNPKAANQASIAEILQRYKKSIIQHAGLEDEDELLQAKFSGNPIQQASTEDEEPLQPKSENKTGLPDDLKAGIENMSGYSMDDVKVHYNSDKPAQLNALAYAQGTDIHVASGQEKHLPHEVWHVVQQKQGRVQPTMQLQGVNVNDNEGLEREADAMGGILAKRGFNKIFNKDKSTESSKNTYIYQRIQHNGVSILVDTITTSTECKVHIARIARINAGHPQGNDNEFNYDPNDLDDLKARRDLLLNQEKETRKALLVSELDNRRTVLATGAGWIGQPGWVGQNHNAGLHNETSGDTVNTNLIDDIIGLWQNFLVNPPYIHLHPRTGVNDNSRLVSADGIKSIRYGQHEMDSDVNLHHYHEETWSQAPDNSIKIENKIRRVPVK